MTTRLHTDVCIVGGGIAGLWLAHRLHRERRTFLLVEGEALGAGQTVRSQGIIHGGVKYSLRGVWSPAARAVAAMPSRWRAALAGTGPVDLRGARLLSPYHYLWSPGDLAGRLAGFVAAKAVRGRARTLTEEEYPEAFRDSRFRGRIVRLDEPVVDVPSVLAALSAPFRDRCLRVRVEARPGERGIAALVGGGLEVTAATYVLTAGEGMEALTAGLRDRPPMQRRPLHMVLAEVADGPAVFAHCLGAGSKPRVTITSHPGDGGRVWYLGGDLAETGVTRSEQDQVAFARRELRELLPWRRWEETRMAGLRVERAEAAQHRGMRPEGATVRRVGNAVIAWPTKLALAPDLADRVLDHLDPAPSGALGARGCIPESLPQAEVARPPWRRGDW